MIYDVVIMGGGPAGATLAALLSRHTKLKTALYEKEFFPREHIGESLTPGTIPAMARSGALPKVLASDCYIGPKVGAYFAWDSGRDPFISLFNHTKFDRGVVSWAFHVNRSEFDKILLDHARDIGTEVFEGVGVTEIHRENDHTRVVLDDGTEAHCRIFVDASGRQTSVTGTKKRFLSDYKNVAIWNHVVNAKPPGSVDAPWNMFYDRRHKIPGFTRENWSPIANFACEDGWFWYIPVRKLVMGKRTDTISLGIVTDTEIVKKAGKRFTNTELLLARAREVPILRDMLVDAVPVSDKVLTATNYSMISETLCNYDEKWLLVGDCAMFVDPLFSTGVSNAMLGASAAHFLIEGTLASDLPEQGIRDLWYDYQHRTTSNAVTFALGIDQWYHAISRCNPSFEYWKAGLNHRKELHHKTFTDLINLEVIEQVFYDHTIDRKHDGWRAMMEEGGLFARPELTGADGKPPAASAKIKLHPGVGVRKSVLLGQLRQKNAPDEFWGDPLTHGNAMDGIPAFHDCHRFFLNGDMVPFNEGAEAGLALHEVLHDDALTYGELGQKLAPPQHQLLARLQRAGMVLIDGKEVTGLSSLK